MKLQLDTKKKQLTLEKTVTLMQLTTIVETIFPSDFDRRNYDFLINVGTVPDKDIIAVTIPLSRNWNYYPNFKWLNYSKDNAVMVENELTNSANGNTITFNEGVYNIEINIK